MSSYTAAASGLLQLLKHYLKYQVLSAVLVAAAAQQLCLACSVLIFWLCHVLQRALLRRITAHSSCCAPAARMLQAAPFIQRWNYQREPYVRHGGVPDAKAVPRLCKLGSAEWARNTSRTRAPYSLQGPRISHLAARRSCRSTVRPSADVCWVTTGSH